MPTPQPDLKKALIIGDPHRPYHDKRAWDLVLQVGHWFKPYHLGCIGDFADFYTVSSHSKDPNRALKLDEELKDIKTGLDELDALNAKEKFFIGGNHEDRLQRYLQDKAPELFNLIDVPKLFKLEERGWTYTPYKQDRKLGKLNLTHDIGSAGRYSTYKALDMYQHSVVTGHTHRLSYIVEGNVVGEHKLSASFGWLGDVEKIDYMHRAKAKKDWALGFGVGYINPATGIAYLTPVPIVVAKGVYSCVVNGRFFSN